MYFAYILYSPSHQRPNTGQTDDVSKRLKRHNAGVVMATKAYVPWELVACEEFETRAGAMRRERWLKSGVGRGFVKQLIEEHKKRNG